VAPYERAIRISPNNTRVRYNLGWAYNHEARYAEAVPVLAEAVRIKPEYVEGHTELGFSYYKLHRLPAAIESLQTAIRLKNNHATAHLYLGFVYIEQKNKQGAVSEYTILKTLDPAKAQQLFDAAPPGFKN
jgi:tetratricopeptide (TPR) repeat protein